MISFTATADMACRIGRTLALAGLMLGLCACLSLPRPAPIQSPATLLQEPGRLKNPQTRPAAYKQLFPELATLQAFGIMTVTVRGEHEKNSFQVTFFGFPPPESPERQDVRLKVTHQLSLNDIADIMVREGRMTVVLGKEKNIFQGPVALRGSFLACLLGLERHASPLARVLGLEPGELARILAIGNQIARSEMTASGANRLKPATPAQAGGLRLVVLDQATGLPCQAAWTLPGGQCIAEYPAWDFFSDGKTGQRQLMPAQVRLLLKRGWVTIALDLRNYQFNKKPTPALFTMNSASLDTYKLYPLEELKKVF